MINSEIKRDAKVRTQDGELGHVTHVIVDTTSNELTDIVVKDRDTEWLIPASAIGSVNGDTVMLSGRSADMSRFSHFDKSEFMAVDEDTIDERASSTSAMGGANRVVDAETDSVQVGGTRSRPRDPSSSPTRMGRRNVGNTMELREEELSARKERVDAGKVEIEKDVVTEHKTLEVPVSREEVVVHRNPVNREATNEQITGDEEIEVTVMREEVTPEKRTVVYEEIEVEKRVFQGSESVSGDVRREVDHVSSEGDVDVAGQDTSRGMGRAWDEMSDSYRSRWQQQYGSTGGRWEDAEPGYRYGHEVASDPRYRNREWSEIEPEARRDYNDWSRKQGYVSDKNTWEQIKDFAQTSWKEGRSRVQR